MIMASTLTTIEAVIPYVIVAGVVVFFVLRLAGVPFIDTLRRARKRTNQHRE